MSVLISALIHNHTILGYEGLSQIDSKVENALLLHIADLVLIPGTPYSSLSMVGIVLVTAHLYPIRFASLLDL